MWGALILAGGRSLRMRGNKALMKLGSKTLLLHIVEKVSGLTQEIVVTIGKNERHERYVDLLPSTVVIIKDLVEGMGPLAGISIGMQHMHSDYTLVLPCDSPFIKKGVLEYLLNIAQGADAAIPRWPNGRIEPLHAVYKVSTAMPAATIALRRDERLILDMIKRLNKVIYVDINEIRRLDPDFTTFFNINTKEDFERAEMLLSNM